jgi:hypothetical protein
MFPVPKEEVDKLSTEHEWEKKERRVHPVGYLETGVLYCDDKLHRLSQLPPNF